MRPLWLSDLAWSVGLEPSLALGIIGALLATLLSIQTVLDRSRRIHPSIIFFPILVILALILVNPLEMETPPPPQRLEDIKGGGSMSDKGGLDKRGGASGGQADQNDRIIITGSQEKQNQMERGKSLVLLRSCFWGMTTPHRQSIFYLRQGCNLLLMGFA